MRLINHIIIRDGFALIAGKEHLKAEMVARMVVDGEYTPEEVADHYGLTTAEVHSALAWYYDNQPELDASREEILAEIRENAMTLDKLRAKIADSGQRSLLEFRGVGARLRDMDAQEYVNQLRSEWDDRP